MATAGAENTTAHHRFDCADAPDDRSDIDAMIEQGLITHDDVVSCFREAIDFKMDLTAGEFARYVEHLNTVERDMFGVAETEFEEPSWLR